MSLYNEPGRGRTRTLLLATVAALLVGLLAGALAGRSSAGDPTAAELVSQLRQQLAPARAGLELVPTEYAQVRGGAGGEGAAVQGDLRRARDALAAAAPDLRALDPQTLEAAESAVDALADAIDAGAPTAEVQRRASAATAALGEVPGGS